MSSYILSEQADADLESIYKYTLDTWGIEQFKRYRDQLNAAFKFIAKEPKSIQRKAREDLASGCCFYHVGHHYIVYRISKQHIEVGRILHESMNFGGLGRGHVVKFIICSFCDFSTHRAVDGAIQVFMIFINS